MRRFLPVGCFVLALMSFALPARFYGAVQARFTSVDPVAINEECIADPQQLNLYGYGRGNPLLYIDPSGETIYMVVYSTDDPNGKEAAEARQKEIQGQKTFDSKKDIVVVFGASSFNELKANIENTVNNFNKKYGATGEFDLFSHAVSSSGPRIGPRDYAMGKQWSEIQFKWGQNAEARFYGCNTGNQEEAKGLSFAKRFADEQSIKTLGQPSEVKPLPYRVFDGDRFSPALNGTHYTAGWYLGAVYLGPRPMSVFIPGGN